MSIIPPDLPRRVLPLIAGAGIAALGFAATLAPTYKQLQQQIVVLKAQVATLEANVSVLTAQTASDRELITQLHARIDELVAQLPPVIPPVAGSGLIGFNTGQPIPSFITALPITRTYFGPDAIPASWASKDTIVKAMALNCTDYMISTKTADVAKLDAFYHTVPAGINIYMSYYHEHEGNLRDGSLTFDQYNAGSIAVANVTHQNGFLYGPMHNGMNLVNGKWVVAGWVDVTDTSIYDYWGSDLYPPNFNEPTTYFKPLKDKADSLGLPLMIGESAVPISTAQPAYASKLRTWMLANTDGACWWHGQVSAAKPNFRLSDESFHSWMNV